MRRLLLAGQFALVLAGLAFFASLVLAGWMYRDRFLGSPESVRAPTADQALLAGFSQRPIRMPLPGSGACPAGPYVTRQPAALQFRLLGAYGAGPVYLIGGPATHTRWGSYFSAKVVLSPGLRGPVLVRGRDLTRSRTVVFVGEYGGEPVVGADVLGGQTVIQHGSAVLPSAPDSSWLPLWLTPGIASGESGCTVFQVDGADFSETVVAVHFPEPASGTGEARLKMSRSSVELDVQSWEGMRRSPAAWRWRRLLQS